MMKSILILTFSFVYFFTAFSQHGFYGKEDKIEKICQRYSTFSFGQAPINKESSKDINEVSSRILKRILFSVESPTNFVFQECENIQNCMASKDEYLLYLLYNPNYINSLDEIDYSTAQKNDWEKMTVLAHEVGHLFFQHWRKSSISKPHLELEADRFAGKVMARLGANLSEAQSVMKTAAVLEFETYTHPSKNDRLEAIKDGWESVQNKKSWRIFQRGLTHYLKGNKKKSLEFFLDCKDIPEANYLIGTINYKGAVPFWKHAAKLGNTASMLRLAFEASGVVDNYSGNQMISRTFDAFKWYQNAAQHGSREGMYMVGEYFEKGIPKHNLSSSKLDPNIEIAFEWYTRAARLGYPKGALAIGRILSGNDWYSQFGNKKYSKVDYPKAYEWLLKAYENGESEALFYLGILTEQGKGTPKSIKRAVNIYEQFLHEIEYPMNYTKFVYENLLWLYYNDKEYSKLYFLSKKGTEKHIHASCFYFLAACYSFGWEVEQDYSRMKKYLIIAAKMGYKPAIDDCTSAGITY